MRNARYAAVRKMARHTGALESFSNTAYDATAPLHNDSRNNGQGLCGIILLQFTSSRMIHRIPSLNTPQTKHYVLFSNSCSARDHSMLQSILNSPSPRLACGTLHHIKRSYI